MNFDLFQIETIGFVVCVFALAYWGAWLLIIIFSSFKEMRKRLRYWHRNKRDFLVELLFFVVGCIMLVIIVLLFLGVVTCDCWNL